MTLRTFLCATVRIAVAFLLTMTPSLTLAQEPPLPHDGGAPATTQTKAPTFVMSVLVHGGPCIGGVHPEIGVLTVECSRIATVASDGAFTVQDHTKASTTGRLPRELVERLERAIERADFAAIRSRPFKGLCPTAYDGDEIVCTFGTRTGHVVVASCSYIIDWQLELFQTVEEVQTAVYREFGK